VCDLQAHCERRTLSRSRAVDADTATVSLDETFGEAQPDAAPAVGAVRVRVDTQEPVEDVAEVAPSWRVSADRCEQVAAGLFARRQASATARDRWCHRCRRSPDGDGFPGQPPPRVTYTVASSPNTGDGWLCDTGMTHLTAMTAVHAADRLADWQTALRAENKSPGTVTIYADGVTRYLRWCTEHDHLPMSRAALNQWIAGLLDAGAAPGTARIRQLAVLVDMLRLLAHRRRRDPHRSDSRRQGTPRRTAAGRAAHRRRASRPHRDLCRAGRQGARRGDPASSPRRSHHPPHVGDRHPVWGLIDLKVDDLDLIGRPITIRRGEGGRGRVIRIGPATTEALLVYLDEREQHHQRPVAGQPRHAVRRGRAQQVPETPSSLRRSPEAGLHQAHPRGGDAGLHQAHPRSGQLRRDARDLFPDDATADAVIASIATRSTYALPPPLASDGLLAEDPVLVSEWVQALYRRALDATGLTDRDLMEDAVAAQVYVLVACLVVVMLVNVPVLATLGGMLGLAAHPPAKAASALSRTAFRKMNQL
jgi:integrase